MMRVRPSDLMSALEPFDVGAGESTRARARGGAEMRRTLHPGAAGSRTCTPSPPRSFPAGFAACRAARARAVGASRWGRNGSSVRPHPRFTRGMRGARLSAAAHGDVAFLDHPLERRTRQERQRPRQELPAVRARAGLSAQARGVPTARSGGRRVPARRAAPSHASNPNRDPSPTPYCSLYRSP